MDLEKLDAACHFIPSGWNVWEGRKERFDLTALRCFLLRLGFIGDEFKCERKILLRRLSGNSAWKGGAPNTE